MWRGDDFECWLDFYAGRHGDKTNLTLMAASAKAWNNTVYDGFMLYDDALAIELRKLKPRVRMVAGSRVPTMKPPLGLRPSYVVRQYNSADRIDEIVSAMLRYSLVGLAIPEPWIVEFDALISNRVFNARAIFITRDECDYFAERSSRLRLNSATKRTGAFDALALAAHLVVFTGSFYE